MHKTCREIRNELEDYLLNDDCSIEEIKVLNYFLATEIESLIQYTDFSKNKSQVMSVDCVDRYINRLFVLNNLVSKVCNEITDRSKKYKELLDAIYDEKKTKNNEQRDKDLSDFFTKHAGATYPNSLDSDNK